MRINAKSVEDYVAQLPGERAEAINILLNVHREHLPSGFEEGLLYDMPSFFVPHERYPSGYHCDPSLPLPFISIGNQKNHIGLYHSGVYAVPELLGWFEAEWPKHVPTKLDMGKSCIRFKRVDRIPYDLVAELAEKMTVDEWIEVYERVVKR